MTPFNTVLIRNTVSREFRFLLRSGTVITVLVVSSISGRSIKPEARRRIYWTMVSATPWYWAYMATWEGARSKTGIMAA
jgi:hypothetical protein